MAVSSLRLKSDELVGVLRTRRQSLAGTIRQTLIDADRQRASNRTPLEKCSNDQLRYEVEILHSVLALLTQHGLQAKWARAEIRELEERETFEQKLLFEQCQ